MSRPRASVDAGSKTELAVAPARPAPEPRSATARPGRLRRSLRRRWTLLLGLSVAIGFCLLAPLTYLLQYDARLVVPLVFVPVALLALRWRATLGWTLGLAAPVAPATRTSQGAAHG